MGHTVGNLMEPVLGMPSIFGPAVHRAAPAAAAPTTQGSGPCGSTASRGNGNSGG